MPDVSTYASVAATPVSSHRFREPTIYFGRPEEDPVQWLKDYERIARYNSWDEESRLTNVYFSLAGTAKKWYGNNETAIPNWQTFQQQFTATFITPYDSSKHAKKELEQRAQTAMESCEEYAQDVLNLCRATDPRMTDPEKLQHLMKGVAEDVYTLLLAIRVDSTATFLEECRRIEKMRQTRLSDASSFKRLPHVVSIGINPYPAPSLQNDVIQRIQDQITALQSQLQELLAPVNAVTEQYNPRPRWSPPAAVNTAPSRVSQQRRPNNRQPQEWRTPQDKPICFYCHRVGHIIKYCRTRQNAERSVPQYQRRQRSTYTPIFDAPVYQQNMRPTYAQPRRTRSISPANGKRHATPYRQSTQTVYDAPAARNSRNQSPARLEN